MKKYIFSCFEQNFEVSKKLYIKMNKNKINVNNYNINLTERNDKNG